MLTSWQIKDISTLLAIHQAAIQIMLTVLGLYKEKPIHSSIFIFSEILLLDRNVLRLKVPSQGAMYVVIEQGS
jgi:hypothetical protein